MQKNRVKTWELALLLALCVCLCEAAVESGRAEALSENIVRLHVIADSDAAGAQKLKLGVRDAVLPLLTELLESADDANEARTLIEGNRAGILAEARSAAEGQSVELLFGRESYPYRQTESYALPAGEYSSLRIIIGEGTGRNWWGIIYPQLDASGAYTETLNLSGDELRLLWEEDGVIVRFRLIELWENLKELFR